MTFYVDSTAAAAADRSRKAKQNSPGANRSTTPSTILLEDSFNITQQEIMSSVPITYATVNKVRKQWEHANANRDQPLFEKPQQSSYEVAENPPVKYSGKLMNSIWGLYNLYSPPSFQKNNEAQLN